MSVISVTHEHGVRPRLGNTTSTSKTKHSNKAYEFEVDVDYATVKNGKKTKIGKYLGFEKGQRIFKIDGDKTYRVIGEELLGDVVRWGGRRNSNVVTAKRTKHTSRVPRRSTRSMKRMSTISQTNTAKRLRK
jgi:hypothetical protein